MTSGPCRHLAQILGRDLGGCLGGFLGGFCQPQLEIFVFLAVEGGLRVGLRYVLRIVDLHDPPSRCTITIQSWKRYPKVCVISPKRGHLEILGCVFAHGSNSAVEHGRNPVPFAKRVCGNAEKYHALKAQRYRRKPRREPRLGPRREPRRVWFRSIGGYLGGF